LIDPFDRPRSVSLSPRVSACSRACSISWRYYQGRGIHVAARIGTEAAGGEILISSETVAGTAGRFSVGDLRSVSLKGIEQPIELGRIDSR